MRTWLPKFLTGLTLCSSTSQNLGALLGFLRLASLDPCWIAPAVVFQQLWWSCPGCRALLFQIRYQELRWHRRSWRRLTRWLYIILIELPRWARSTRGQILQVLPCRFRHRGDYQICWISKIEQHLGEFGNVELDYRLWHPRESLVYLKILLLRNAYLDGTQQLQHRSNAHLSSQIFLKDCYFSISTI